MSIFQFENYCNANKKEIPLFTVSGLSLGRKATYAFTNDFKSENEMKAQAALDIVSYYRRYVCHIGSYGHICRIVCSTNCHKPEKGKNCICVDPANTEDDKNNESCDDDENNEDDCQDEYYIEGMKVTEAGENASLVEFYNNFKEDCSDIYNYCYDDPLIVEFFTNKPSRMEKYQHDKNGNFVIDEEYAEEQKVKYKNDQVNIKWIDAVFKMCDKLENLQYGEDWQCKLWTKIYYKGINIPFNNDTGTHSF
jgi:hypothetical protein